MVSGTLAAIAGSPRLRWELAAFLGGLLVYAITRFWRLSDYPIFFFTDEAFEPITAERLLHNHFRDASGHLFPLYFQNGGAWCPVLPIWLHVVTVGLFGKSIEVARATAAAVTLVGAAAVGLTLKTVFRSRLWWTAPLFLATTPVFFHHSRTTFETVFMVSFFACFLLFYLLYRTRSPWFLYPAILFGGIAFYSYSVGQVVMAAASGLLLLVDLPYHVRKWRFVLPGLVLIAVVAFPLLRFRHDEPDAARGQLSRVSSYWISNAPIQEKAKHYGQEWLAGLSPRYWFFPTSIDWSRHRMAGYGQIRTSELPLVVIGLGLCLWRIRRAPYRDVLVCVLAAPAGAALAAIAITRTLSFVLPATILAVLGASLLYELIGPPRVQWAVGVALFLLLSVSSVALLADALHNGPLWFRDYGLYGQQWGAKQIFEVIPKFLRADPRTKIALSSDWANGADLYPRFFFPLGSADAARVSMGSVHDAAAGGFPDIENTVFVTTPDELKFARGSRRFTNIRVEREIAYPDGKPGFEFVRLDYSPELAQILAHDKEELRKLVDDKVVLGSETLNVRHSKLDMGSLTDIFDGDRETLGRFNAANPAVLEIRFPRPRPIHAVVVTVGSGTWDIQVTLAEKEDGSAPHRYSAFSKDAGPDPTVTIPTDKGPSMTGYARIAFHYVDAGEFAIIHVRDVRFR